MSQNEYNNKCKPKPPHGVYERKMKNENLQESAKHIKLRIRNVEETPRIVDLQDQR